MELHHLADVGDGLPLGGGQARLLPGSLGVAAAEGLGKVAAGGDAPHPCVKGLGWLLCLRLCFMESVWAAAWSSGTR